MLPKSENLVVEFKSDLKKYPDSEIFEVIVALANTEGGDLYLGVEDDGTITGVHKEHSNPISLAAYVANHTVPPVSIRAEIIEEELPVLKISVPKAYNGIVSTISGKVLRRRLKADGTPETVAMYPSEYNTRLSDLRMLDYSAVPIMQATIEDFDIKEIDRLRNLIMTYNGDKTLLDLSDEELFKALGFVREIGTDFYPTVTGILMVGNQYAIEKYIPTAKTSFQVLQGTEVRINEDMSIPLLATIEYLNTYLTAWNPEQELEIGLFRVSVPEFNKRAIREAIINAFSHRDYTRMGRVRIAITDEGMTVANPGGFIEGVSIDNLLTAEPHGRNPHLADVLKRIGLAERTGRGIDRIFEGSLMYGKPLPDYSESTSVTVSLFIPRSKPDIKLSEIILNEQKRLGHPLSLNSLIIMNALKDMPKATATQLSEQVHFSEVIIKSVLESFVSNGLVESYGNGKNRNYILSPRLYNSAAEKRGYVRLTDIDESRHLELIKKMAEKNEFVARGDVIELLHVDEDRAYKLLKKLVNAGVLELVNRGKYAKYRLK